MGHAYQSPLKRHEVLAGLIKAAKAKTFVEVGCKEGRTSAYLLDQFPDLRVIAIDPWAALPNPDEDYKDWDFEAIERDFWMNIGANKARCTHHRATSFDAAGYISGPFDAVFIDAAHDYENVIQDIQLWWPLVRSDGYLCGHDYQHKFPGVMRAVAECFPLLRVAVCPDSVWVVQKAGVPALREAA
jgi:predicted O-methyltransferase YrrM